MRVFKKEKSSHKFFLVEFFVVFFFFGMEVAEFGLPLSCVLRFGFEQW